MGGLGVSRAHTIKPAHTHTHAYMHTCTHSHPHISEFLPPPYCPRDAQGEAVADFQEINEFMAGWLQREWVAAGGALTRRVG